MNALRWPSLVALAVCGAFCPAVCASEADRLAGQAQEVLARHCRACHDGAEGKAGLDVLDRKQLLDSGLINLATPASSELLDLVESGSMPPGKHRKVPAADREALLRWVKAKAPTESPSAYVLRHLLRDWRTLPDADKPNARYLSLAHLAGPESAKRLEAFRKELTDLLTFFKPTKKAGRAKPIDPAGLVLRIDLAALGWDLKSFEERDAFNDDPKVRKQAKVSQVNLYDLLLLEYPYGSISFSSPHFEGLRRYLDKAKPVRPVPWVRADWLAGQLAAGEVGKELALMLGVGDKKKPQTPTALRFRDGRVTLEEARAEVGWAGDEARLTKALKDEGLKGLEDSKGVGRAEWEAAYPGVIRRLGVETPILPLDGLDAPGSMLTRPDSSGLSVRTADPKNGNAKSEFETGGEVEIEVSTRADVTYELLRWGRLGGRAEGMVFPKSFEELTAKKGSHTYDVLLGQDVGTERFLVVAFAKKQVKKKGDFPRGLELEPRVEGVRSRFVHPFYRLKKDSDEFDGPAAEEVLSAKVAFTIKMPKK